QKLSNDEINRRRLLDLQKQINDIEQTEKRLEKEIQDIDQKILPSITEHTVERQRIYLKYFEALAEDLNGLKELYAPMQKQLASFGTDMTFELSAGYKINRQEWVDKIVKFFDGRKPYALVKKEEIESFIVEKIIPAWESNDKNQISQVLSDFNQKVSPFDFMQNCAAPSLKLSELFDWMFSTDHISTTYRIKYAGSYLEHLSPGTRGIALLVLYLLMDEDDRRPLIIDQPEGNLDNSSVYSQLVPYIRKAKENRQIIIVTHNPNLVVGTDAEQIIIASSSRSPSQVYPRISYYSGSLEHNESDETSKGIRQTVCILLEGGDKAFKDREGRYSILQPI
ncbi:AAA family ATPase, partial [Acinetobacter venetianus]